MLRKWICGVAVVALSSSFVIAYQGVVTTRDGRTYEGNITEKGETVEIANIKGMPGPVDVKKANVSKIINSDKIGAEILAGLTKLGPRDVAQRILLAKVAIQNHSYAAANEVLQSASAIDPSNAEVLSLSQQVAALLPAAPTALPSTKPATKPAAVAAVKADPGAYTARRMVNADEINRIRQLELRSDEPMVVKIDQPTKEHFLNANPDITRADFAKMSPGQQAAMILDKEKKVVHHGLIISKDPQAIADFKRSVAHVVLRECGACHTGPKAGNFVLFNPTSNDNAAVYTNFLVLMSYSQIANGAVRQMVDRDSPNASLLLQYMLPAALAEAPHPEVKGPPAYHGLVKTKEAPMYKQTLNWINSLSPGTPHYNIDLTKDESAPLKK